MRGILRIARTEVLEHRRQPAMLFILTFNYVLYISLFGLFFLALDSIASQPETMAMMLQRLDVFGIELDTALRVSVGGLTTLLFTNMTVFVAYMSSFSVLNDKINGTMPFLMLAPVTRRQLLVGKLAGTMAIPLLLHLIFVGVGCLLVSQLEVLAHFRDRLGGSPAWWVAYLLGGPASAAFVGALSAVISALSRDVRTSMQFTSFSITLLSVGIGLILVESISAGAALQLVYAAGCLVAAGLTLLVGARVISQDIGGS